MNEAIANQVHARPNSAPQSLLSIASREAGDESFYFCLSDLEQAMVFGCKTEVPIASGQALCPARPLSLLAVASPDGRSRKLRIEIESDNYAWGRQHEI